MCKPDAYLGVVSEAIAYNHGRLMSTVSPSGAPAERSGPLHGVRVLELGSFIAGPFAGQLLADYGAEVIKVEPVGAGDPMRRWGIVHGGEGLWWPSIARNKRSVSIDLRDERGRELVRALASHCDIVIENFRPGRLSDWGLDYAELSARNPRIVMVHVSGYGQTGPRASAAGFGSIGEAVGGIRHTTGERGRRSVRTGISLGDSLAAMFSVIGALAALAEARVSGAGQEVDVAIYESVAALMESSMADFAVAGVRRERTGAVLPGVAPSNAYPTADCAEVIIAANADSVFARLCNAMGRDDLVKDPRFTTHEARGEHMAELDELVGAWTSTTTAESLLEVLDAHGVPADRIFTVEDMLTDPQYLAREMVLDAVDQAGRSLPITGIVPKFSRTPGEVRWLGPALGEDTADVLTSLAGCGASELAALAEASVIGGPDLA